MNTEYTKLSDESTNTLELRMKKIKKKNERIFFLHKFAQG